MATCGSMDGTGLGLAGVAYFVHCRPGHFRELVQRSAHHFAATRSIQASENSMILVQLHTGSQVLFDSLADFSGAIRRGELGPSSLIYHRASGQWLPIDAHPEFRKSAAVEEESPLPPLKRMHWTFFTVDGHAHKEESPAEPQAVAKGDTAATGQPGWRSRLSRMVRRSRTSEQA
jgi:hypothetical protein